MREIIGTILILIFIGAILTPLVAMYGLVTTIVTVAVSVLLIVILATGIALISDDD